MAKGNFKRVANLDRSFGDFPDYLLVKVQSDYSTVRDEYLVLTDSEVERFSQKGASLRLPFSSKGALRLAETLSCRSYFVLGARDLLGVVLVLALTEKDLERVRIRSEKKARTVHENKTGWLADLFD